MNIDLKLCLKEYLRPISIISEHYTKNIENSLNDEVSFEKNVENSSENIISLEKNVENTLNNNIFLEKNVRDALDNNNFLKKSVENTFVNVENTLNNVEKNMNNSDINNNKNMIFRCKNCSKIFKKKRYLTQHYNRYNCRNSVIESNDNKKEKQSISEYEAMLNQKDIIIQELRNQISNLVNKVGNTTNYNTYNIVNINPFGSEDTSYISSDYINKIVNEGPYRSIPKLLKYIHFHPEHEENHNIKIPNKKLPYAKVYNGTSWIFKDKKETIDDMSNKAYNVINYHYPGGNNYMNKFKELYENNDSILNKKISKDVELLILNSQNFI